MKLPDRIPMQPILFADGARGSAMQQYRSEFYGVSLVAERASRSEPFVESWSCDALPGQAFATYGALRLAVEALP